MSVQWWNSGLDPKKRQEANKALANALDGKPVESRVTLKYQPEPTVDVKSDEELDKVYRAVLNELTLKPEHRNNLLKRGLTNEVIDKCLYRSVPERWVSVFAKLKKRGISFEGVPGFYEKNGKTFSACSKSGFFIPYFNSKGQIVGMQIRFDKGDNDISGFRLPDFKVDAVPETLRVTVFLVLCRNAKKVKSCMLRKGHSKLTLLVS